MTGKDLIMFILKHDLLNTKLDGKIRKLFLTVDEAAVKLGISTTSLTDMIELGLIDYIEFDGVMYIYQDVNLRELKRR